MNTGTSSGNASRSVSISHSGFGCRAARASSQSGPQPVRPGVDDDGSASTAARHAASASADDPRRRPGGSCRSGRDPGRSGPGGSGTVIRRQSVMTSVNRQPTASMTSACGSAACARTDRAWPSESGLRSSSRPLPLSVVMTGAPSRRARASIAPAAPDQSAPPPARMIGRSGLGQDLGGLGDRVDRHGRGRAAAGTPGCSPTPEQAARIRSWGRNRAAGPRPSPGHRLERPAQQAGTWSTRRSVPHHSRHRAEDPLEVDLMVVAALAIQRIGVDLSGEQEDRAPSRPSTRRRRSGRWSRRGRRWCRRPRARPSPAQSRRRRRRRPARCGPGSSGSSRPAPARRRSSSSASPASRTGGALPHRARPSTRTSAPVFIASHSSSPRALSRSRVL